MLWWFRGCVVLLKSSDSVCIFDCRFVYCFDYISFFFSSRRRHTVCALVTWSSDVCSSDLIAAVKVFLIQQIIIRIDPRSRHCISDREAGRKLKIGIIADETCQLAAIAEARIITRHSQRERLIGRSPAQLPANIVVSAHVGRRSIEPHETPISVPLVIGAGKTDSEFIPHERKDRKSTRLNSSH